MRRAIPWLVSDFVFLLPLVLGPQVVAQAGADSTAASAEAQRAVPAAAEALKFTNKGQLVLVPVVVTGDHGEYVGGLGRDAFKIEEGKKARETAIFEEVKTVAPKAKARAEILAGRSNFNDSDLHVTVVVLDMVNTPYLYVPGGKQHLVDFLSRILSNSLQRGEPTAMFGLGKNGLTLLHPFTSDTAVLVEALRHVEPEMGAHKLKESPPTVAGQSADMQRAVYETAQRISDFINERPTVGFYQRDFVWTTLDAMAQVGHAYPAIPGRKTLIWASGGLPFQIDDMEEFARLGPQTMEKYAAAWRALDEAGVAGYPVDLAELADRGSSLYVRFRATSHSRDTLNSFADATGGTACLKTTEVERCIAGAEDDSHAYYLLGYYLPANDKKAGWRKLKVNVAAAGVHVRARQGFYVPDAAEKAAETSERRMLDALRSPVDFTGVRFNVREVPVSTGSKPVAAEKSLHKFSVRVAGNSIVVDAQNGNAIDMTLVAVAFAANGKNAGNTELHMTSRLPPEKVGELRKSGIQGTALLELAPGNYDIHFVVRDNQNGGIGSVVYPLEVK
jgi:VWFA-related protein